MNINRLGLLNFSCFERREFAFGTRFNLIIGDNPKGKTTLLNALAVGLGSLLVDYPLSASTRSILHAEARRDFVPWIPAWAAEAKFPVGVECTGEVEGDGERHWLQERSSAEGTTKLRDSGWIRERRERIVKLVMRGEPVILPVVAYYGSGRLPVQLLQSKIISFMPQIVKRRMRFTGYADWVNPPWDVKRLVHLFRTSQLSELQRRVHVSALEVAESAITSFAPEVERVRFDVARDDLALKFADRSVPISYLGDGFRNIVTMVADIAVRCATLNPQLKEEALLATPGVVLIDELEQHLHPRWQRRVVGDLLRAFPRIQFFGTTHSPFVIQSLPSTRDVSLTNLDDRRAENVANKSVEDIAEEIQGIELPQRSRRFQEMMEAAEEYFGALRRVPQASEEERNRIRARLDELSMPYSDDPAYQAFLKMRRTASGIDGENRDATS
jgi:predicted ATP-binding protein involved in virulence